MPGQALRHRRLFGEVQIRLADWHSRQVGRERDLVGEGAIWLRVGLAISLGCQHRVGIVDHGLAQYGLRQDDRVATGCGDAVEHRHAMRRYHLVEAFATQRHEGVSVDKPADACGHAIGDARDHPAAMVVARQAP